jgi:serine/threonine protein kinase
VARAPESLSNLSGQVLGHFEVGPVFAKGNSGVVFNTRDANNNETVALRVLRKDFAQNEDEMQRFNRAMKTVLPLRHPNLVSLRGAGKTGPYCWLAMEFVDGEA